MKGLLALIAVGFALEFYETHLELRYARECQGRELTLFQAATIQSNRYHHGAYPIIGEKVCR